MRPIMLVVAGVVLSASALVVLVLPNVRESKLTVPIASGQSASSPSWIDHTSSVEPKAAVSYPQQGSGSYDVVPGMGGVIGTSGTLMRFQVAIERGIVGLDGATVAAFIESTYADPRGWASGGKWRFQRVGAGQPYDFVVSLSTPGTRGVLCGDTSDHYTNCRNGVRVVINMDRWVGGVPDYGASLEVYRQYVVNHETGHRLGDGHELCPGPGRPAPVMQQQTLGLHGCKANPWPYLDGKRYRGQPGAYQDPTPG